MPKIDEVKEFIGFMKAIFIMLIVIDTSLIAWIFKNFENESMGRLYIVVFIVLVISIVVALLFVKILKEIKHLKDL
jgi:asparagine N-glycosylation enzyme membrane subunit Stt3